MFAPGNRLIVALDVETGNEALALAERMAGAASWVKVGLELYTAEGPGFVRELVGTGARVMLDLKLHDIPATVGRATARAAALGVELLTIHAAGGREMIKAAVAAAAGRTRILGVTVLTSLDDDDLADVGIAAGVQATVARRAQLAVLSGCHGVVASPHEAGKVRSLVPPEFLIVTPGVRPAGADPGDQKRVMTPAAARAAGADLIVVGRPIRDARDPAAAARAIAAELAD